MKPIFILNGRMVVARPSKLATSILMASSVAVIVECREQTMGNMHTRLNVPTVAMCMEQTGLICTRESAQSVKKGHSGSDTGRLPSVEILRQIGRERETKRYPLWQNEDENSLQLKRQKRSAGGKST